MPALFEVGIQSRDCDQNIALTSQNSLDAD